MKEQTIAKFIPQRINKFGTPFKVDLSKRQSSQVKLNIYSFVIFTPFKLESIWINSDSFAKSHFLMQWADVFGIICIL